MKLEGEEAPIPPDTSDPSDWSDRSLPPGPKQTPQKRYGPAPAASPPSKKNGLKTAPHLQTTLPTAAQAWLRSSERFPGARAFLPAYIPGFQPGPFPDLKSQI